MSCSASLHVQSAHSATSGNPKEIAAGRPKMVKASPVENKPKATVITPMPSVATP